MHVYMICSLSAIITGEWGVVITRHRPTTGCIRNGSILMIVMCRRCKEMRRLCLTRLISFFIGKENNDL